MKTQDKENRAKIDLELKKILKMLEEEKKMNRAKAEGFDKQTQILIQKMQSLERENEYLRTQAQKITEIDFENQLAELEDMQKSVLQENQNLKQELEIIRKGNNLQDLALLSADIHKIARQVHHLLSVLQSLRQGKDISLSLLLEMDEARAVSSSRQLVLDVAQLKKDLNAIKGIVSDYHAESVGGSICITN